MAEQQWIADTGEARKPEGEPSFRPNITVPTFVYGLASPPKRLKDKGVSSLRHGENGNAISPYARHVIDHSMPDDGSEGLRTIPIGIPPNDWPPQIRGDEYSDEINWFPNSEPNFTATSRKSSFESIAEAGLSVYQTAPTSPAPELRDSLATLNSSNIIPKISGGLYDGNGERHPRPDEFELGPEYDTPPATASPNLAPPNSTRRSDETNPPILVAKPPQVDSATQLSTAPGVYAGIQVNRELQVDVATQTSTALAAIQIEAATQTDTALADPTLTEAFEGNTRLAFAIASSSQDPPDFGSPPRIEESNLGSEFTVFGRIQRPRSYSCEVTASHEVDCQENSEFYDSDQSGDEQSNFNPIEDLEIDTTSPTARDEYPPLPSYPPTPYYTQGPYDSDPYYNHRVATRDGSDEFVQNYFRGLHNHYLGVMPQTHLHELLPMVFDRATFYDSVTADMVADTHTVYDGVVSIASRDDAHVRYREEARREHGNISSQRDDAINARDGAHQHINEEAVKYKMLEDSYMTVKLQYNDGNIERVRLANELHAKNDEIATMRIANAAEEKEKQHTRDEILSLKDEIAGLKADLKEARAGNLYHGLKDINTKLILELKDAKALIKLQSDDYQSAISSVEQLCYIHGCKLVVVWKHVESLKSQIAAIKAGQQPYDANNWKIDDFRMKEMSMLPPAVTANESPGVIALLGGHAGANYHKLDFPPLLGRPKSSHSHDDSDVSTLAALDNSPRGFASPDRKNSTTVWGKLPDSVLMPPPPPRNTTTYAQVAGGSKKSGKHKSKYKQPVAKGANIEPVKTAIASPGRVDRTNCAVDEAALTANPSFKVNPSARSFIPTGSPTMDVATLSAPTTDSKSPIIAGQEAHLNPFNPEVKYIIPEDVRDVSKDHPMFDEPQAPTTMGMPPLPQHLRNATASVRKAALREQAREIAPELLNLIISNLPERFSNICPISLTTAEVKCMVKGCRLRKVCDAYNSTGCRDEACGCVHEYRTCADEIAGEMECLNKKDSHLAKRAHKGAVGAEEWVARETLAGLRDSHVLRRWLEGSSAK